MAEKPGKAALLPIAAIMLALCFLTGIIESIIQMQSRAILGTYLWYWLSTGGLLAIARWTPAVLLVSGAINGELAEDEHSFAEHAMRSLLPALLIAGAVSIFFLLLVPSIQAKRTLYQESSTLFRESASAARSALDSGQLEVAGAHLLVLRSIDLGHPDYTGLDDKYQEMLVQRARQELLQQDALQKSSQEAETSADGDFFLQARQALEAGRYFDAYYLARQAATIYPNRMEVRNLVGETWHILQNSGPPREQLAAASLFVRKTEAYRTLLDGEILEAYRLFRALRVEAPEDADIRQYLEQSQMALTSVYFFTDEFERAFKRHRALPFRLHFEQDGSVFELNATSAVASMEGVYLRDLHLSATGKLELELTSRYGRLSGKSLVPRSLNRDNPAEVFEETWLRGNADRFDSISSLPFSEAQAREILEFANNPADISLYTLLTGLSRAEALGAAPEPLRRELAARMAYPFATVMLILVGTALGMRFRGPQRGSWTGVFLSAPIMVLLATIPVTVVRQAGLVLAETVAHYVGTTSFIIVWLLAMAACTVLVLLLSVRIALHRQR